MNQETFTCIQQIQLEMWRDHADLLVEYEVRSLRFPLWLLPSGLAAALAVRRVRRKLFRWAEYSVLKEWR